MTHSTPNTSRDNSPVQDNWRDQFLQRILIIAAVLGIFAVITGVLTTDNFILQGIYLGVFITLVTIIVIRPPYLIRAGVFVALPFILGISSMRNAGLRGDSMFFFGHIINMIEFFSIKLALKILSYYQDFMG